MDLKVLLAKTGRSKQVTKKKIGELDTYVGVCIFSFFHGYWSFEWMVEK